MDIAVRVSLLPTCASAKRRLLHAPSLCHRRSLRRFHARSNRHRLQPNRQLRSLVNGSRFAVIFAADAFVHRYQRLLPVRMSLLTAAALVIVGSSVLPYYRLIAALPLAYLLLADAALLRSPRLRFRFDMSYSAYVYAFPVQQVLASACLWSMRVVPFATAAIVCTLPLTALSWRFVERPALTLKMRYRPPETVQELEVSHRANDQSAYRAARVTFVLLAGNGGVGDPNQVEALPNVACASVSATPLTRSTVAEARHVPVRTSRCRECHTLFRGASASRPRSLLASAAAWMFRAGLRDYHHPRCDAQPGCPTW